MKYFYLSHHVMVRDTERCIKDMRSSSQCTYLSRLLMQRQTQRHRETKYERDRDIETGRMRHGTLFWVVSWRWDRETHRGTGRDTAYFFKSSLDAELTQPLDLHIATTFQLLCRQTHRRLLCTHQWQQVLKATGRIAAATQWIRLKKNQPNVEYVQYPTLKSCALQRFSISWIRFKRHAQSLLFSVK